MRSIHSSILLTVLLVIPNVLWPCSCAGPLTPEQNFKTAYAVFSGKALEQTIVDIVDPRGSYKMYEVVFQVDQTWKGVSSEKFTMLTGLDEGSCRYSFDVGREYLVYAHLWESDLSTSICSRTRETSEASEDFAYLNSLSPTIEQNYPNPIRAAGTRIRFVLPVSGHSSLAVYDILGHQVIKITAGYKELGTYDMAWNGKDQRGREAPPGVYFAVITTQRHRKTIKMLLLR